MENNIDKIIALSREKKNILDLILDLTNKQEKAIEDDDLDTLAFILEEKENLMSKIDTKDIQFLKLYELLKGKEGVDTFDEIDINKYNNIKDLKNVVADINDILTEIYNLDKKNREKMKSNIDNVKLNIKNVKKGKKAYKGYNYENGDSILIDEKK